MKRIKREYLEELRLNVLAFFTLANAAAAGGERESECFFEKTASSKDN